MNWPIFLNWLTTLLFTYSRKIELLLLTVNVKNFLTPKNPKMCDPILFTYFKMQPHYSQSSRENTTPFSGTFPLASYKKVPPPALRGRLSVYQGPYLRTLTNSSVFVPIRKVSEIVWIRIRYVSRRNPRCMCEQLPRKTETYESAKCVPCNTRKCTHNGFVSDPLKWALKCRFYATGAFLPRPKT